MHLALQIGVALVVLWALLFIVGVIVAEVRYMLSLNQPPHPDDRVFTEDHPDRRRIGR